MQGVFPTRRLLTIWEKLAFGGKVRTINKDEFIRITTGDYETSSEAYKLMVKAAYMDLMSLLDANKNGKIDMDEHLRSCKSMNHTNTAHNIESFLVAYNNADGVPLAEAADAWVKLRTNTQTTAEGNKIDQAIKAILEP